MVVRLDGERAAHEKSMTTSSLMVTADDRAVDTTAASLLDGAIVTFCARLRRLVVTRVGTTYRLVLSGVEPTDNGWTGTVDLHRVGSAYADLFEPTFEEPVGPMTGAELIAAARQRPKPESFDERALPVGTRVTLTRDDT